MGSFSAPYIFGGGFRVMTTQIVSTRLNGDDRLAMVETVSLALLAMAASVVHVVGSTLAVESAPLIGTFLSACGINLLNWPLIWYRDGGEFTTVVDVTQAQRFTKADGAGNTATPPTPEQQTQETSDAQDED